MSKHINPVSCAAAMESTVGAVSKAAEPHMGKLRFSLTRGDILDLLFRLTVLGVTSYFGIKWIVNAMDPTRKQKQEAKQQAQQLMSNIGVKGIHLTDYEMPIAAQLIDPGTLSIGWEDIGGLEALCMEIKETILLPLRKRHLFKGSTLMQPPKGVLLYGPPGCGKTMIAKAIAKDAGCRFINLQASSLTDKWYGESQKLAAAVFSLARKLQPVIIFIDEIDSFLRSRASQDHEATAMMKAQFMTLWDGLITDNDCEVIIMGATNRPQDVDAAILRRMPTTFHVKIPDRKDRLTILQVLLRNENISPDVDLPQLAAETEGFSGSDLRELCRNACVYIVRDYMRGDSAREQTPGETADHLRPLTIKDLRMAMLRLKESKHLNPLSLVEMPITLE